MKPVLLVDFGSTYTKVTAVDLEESMLMGTAASFTTVETDINVGLKNALKKLTLSLKKDIDFKEIYACSSAAGGLKMIALGLVPELTVQAAKEASLGAGAKIMKSYSHEIIESDIKEIQSLKPDIILLTGGTDGGNKTCLLHNAEMLNKLEWNVPIIIAGNRCCVDECANLLKGKEIYICENVMPQFGKLNILPAQEMIRNIFLKKIIQGKGLSKVTELVSDIIMPTPAAMLVAMELLADGTKNTEGIGELIAVDLGGATTDVYSIANGFPSGVKTVYKGLQEPYGKRTVEGDIGMRYSIRGIVEAEGIERIAELANLSEAEVLQLIDYLEANKEATPTTEALEKLDFALASVAVETAIKRHAGKIEEVYTPMGETYLQSGKDLRSVKNLIATGGALVHAKHPAEIAKHGLYNKETPESLRPDQAKIWVDQKYILAAMGLLSKNYPEVALEIMKREIV